MRHPCTGRLALVALAFWAGLASAENRVEAISTGGSGWIPDKVDVNLVEMDVAAKTTVGFRQTELGRRDGTYELYLRMERQRETSALDPRDKRQAGMNNPLAGVGTFHVGLVGIETDGSRGNPMAVRAGVYGLGRVKEDLMGITEVAYQSGTFGGDGTQPTNQAGLHARMGVRKQIATNFYAEADYTFSPGVKKDWVPGIHLGMKF